MIQIKYWGNFLSNSYKNNQRLYASLPLLFLMVLPFIVFTSCKTTTDPAPSTQTTTTASAVARTEPANNETDVPRNKSITIYFNSTMDANTINSSTVIVTRGTQTVPGTFVFSGSSATFTPSDSWTAQAQYTVLVTTGAKPTNGILFAYNYESVFTTSGTSTTSGNSLTAVDLGTAINYTVLAKTNITTNSTSTVTGNLGLSGASSFITGFSFTNVTSSGYATSSQVSGYIYASDMASTTSTNLSTATSAMATAYTSASNRPHPDFVDLGSSASGNIGGKTLSTGIYKWSGNVTAASDVIISGGANDVWIFQVAGNLSVNSSVKIILAGGAQAKNIFWQVAGQATFEANSHAEGIILSMNDITMKSGSYLHGRAFAQGSVTLNGSVVENP